MFVVMNLFESELDEVSLEDKVLYIVTEENDMEPGCIVRVDNKESDLYKFALLSFACASRGSSEGRIKNYKRFECLDEYLSYVKGITR